MSETMKPNVGADLARIHRVITRGLEVALDRSQAFAAGGYPDAVTREGFLRYARALTAMIHVHHLTEDEVAFPYLHDRYPKAPFGDWSADHRRMEVILEKLQAALGELEAAPEGDSDALVELNQALATMQALWLPHIAQEETHLSAESAARILSDEEQMELRQRFGQHNAQHAQPDYLVVPFMLYNLAPEDRAVMASMMPPIVTQQLMPGPWQEQWAPMKPFLLD